jgi:hypothetical protein
LLASLALANQRLELGRGELWMDAAAETAIGAGDDILSLRHPSQGQDAVGVSATVCSCTVAGSVRGLHWCGWINSPPSRPLSFALGRALF